MLSPKPIPKKSPKGSEIKPRSESNQYTPVPHPSKRDEVKPSRHLGDTSTLKTVKKSVEKIYVSKMRVDIRLTYPSRLRNPRMWTKTTMEI
jgi:hypothetical protein